MVSELDGESMAPETLWERLPANRAAFDKSDAMVGDGAAHYCPASCTATGGSRWGEFGQRGKLGERNF